MKMITLINGKGEDFNVESIKTDLFDNVSSAMSHAFRNDLFGGWLCDKYTTADELKSKVDERMKAINRCLKNLQELSKALAVQKAREDVERLAGALSLLPESERESAKARILGQG
ncbi:hypothetical protein [Prevotella jejuni]|jgi:hypothetical protein